MAQPDQIGARQKGVFHGVLFLCARLDSNRHHYIFFW